MIVVFDLETGGLADHHPNIQLAAVAVDESDGWREVAAFERKIAFDEGDCEEEALEINSFSREAWRGANTEASAIRDFCQWTEPFRCVEKVSKRGNPYTVARLCGHNAAKFDFPRLQRAAAGEFLPADMLVLDTMQLALWHSVQTGNWPENFRLTTLCEHYGVEIADAHDALGDCRMTARLAQRLTENE